MASKRNQQTALAAEIRRQHNFRPVAGDLKAQFLVLAINAPDGILAQLVWFGLPIGLLATISVKCQLQANVYDAGNVGGANNGQPDVAESRAISGDRQQHDRRENSHTYSALLCRLSLMRERNDG